MVRKLSWKINFVHLWIKLIFLSWVIRFYDFYPITTRQIIQWFETLFSFHAFSHWFLAFLVLPLFFSCLIDWLIMVFIKFPLEFSILWVSSEQVNKFYNFIGKTCDRTNLYICQNINKNMLIFSHLRETWFNWIKSTKIFLDKIRKNKLLQSYIFNWNLNRAGQKHEFFCDNLINTNDKIKNCSLKKTKLQNTRLIWKSLVSSLKKSLISIIFFKKYF